MTSYEKIWDVAEDNHGVITSVQARVLGVSAAALVSLATNRKLCRLGHGVYKLEMHVPGPYDEYAQAVALVGETGFVRGASALMLRNLVPFDPGKMYLGVSRRVRRSLSSAYVVKTVSDPHIEKIEGIPVETVEWALKDARACGALDEDRLREVEAQI